MSGNVAINLIVADSKEELETVFNREFIEYTNENPAGIGWIYNRETLTFAPIVEEVENA
jgi:hypothetical protein